MAFFLWPYLHYGLAKLVPFFGFRYLKICPFQPYTKLYTLTLTDYEKNALQIRHFQENSKITSTYSKMTIFIPTSMKLGRHMYPYTWQLSAKFGKTRICQRKVIAKNNEFTMHYVIARLMRAVHCAEMMVVSNWPQWSALSIDTKYGICSHGKLWVNRIWTKVTTRIPPESNTYRLWRHFFRLLFALKRPFFSLKICSDMPSSNTQGTSWPDFWNWSRGPFKTPFCPINLFYITCFDRIIIEKKEWFTITTMKFSF